MDAFERKVRPIYDALDARNWKVATKLANSALAKFKNNALLKTLKAVALDRAGKSQEAFQICEEVRATVPTDDHILHTLCIVYRSTGNLNCLTEAYAAACEKYPKNWDLLQGLFGCYVREGLHTNQQQVATKIYRQKGSEKYFWWVVMSLLLQAWSEPAGIHAPMGVKQTLKLAESMVERHLKAKGQLGSKEALMIYLDILHAQGRTDVALEGLEGNLGDLCPLIREKLQMEAQCHVRLRDWVRAAEKFRELLESQPDDFEALQSYLDCVLPGATLHLRNEHGWMELHYEACQLARRLRDDPQDLDCSGDEDRVEDAEVVVNALVAAMKEDCAGSNLSAQRCAGLAQLEFTSRKLRLGVCEEAKLIEELMAVFSCAADVKEYSSLLNQESKHLLAQQLISKSDELAQSESKKLEGLKIESTAHQIIADLGFPSCASDDELVTVSGTCCKLFANSLDSLSDLDPKEVGPVDNAIRVAVTALMSAHCYSQDRAVHLWQALGALTCTIDKRPFNAELNLDICALYGLLGAPLLALEHLDRLEVKYIQIDSLASHFILPVLLAYHRNGETRRLLVEAILLFEEHNKDAGETIFAAYQRGTFTKIFEFLDFKESLELSHTYFFALAEEGILRLTESTGAAPDVMAHKIKEVCSALPMDMVNDAHLHRMRFNEDLGCRSQWFSPCVRHLKMCIREWWEGWGAGNRVQWPETSTYKESRKKLLRHRWLLPHILSGMWLGDGLEAAREGLTTVLRDAGVDLDDCITHFKDGVKSWENGSVGLLDKLEAFKHTTLALGVYMATALEKEGNGCTELAHLYMEMWDKLVDTLCSKTLQKSCGEGIDTCICSLLSEDIPWMGYSFQYWLQKIHSKKKNDKTEAHPVEKTIADLLPGVIGPLRRVVDYVNDMVKQGPSEKVSMLVAAIENSRPSGVSVPWDSGSKSAVQDCFSNVIAEQLNSWKLCGDIGGKLLVVLEGLQVV